ncbi:hypothetical protein CBR_g19610 [Chara braunii]|nr:hypothetical protein CBR_g19610 [Chara braunii]|eukprot:GBG75098.1 hypothetical protein CBR_g19610 [Chara braunii]
MHTVRKDATQNDEAVVTPRLESSAIDKIREDCQVRVSTTSQHMITKERNKAKTNLDGVETNEQLTLMMECELRTRIEVDHGETDCARLALQPASNLLGGSADIAVDDKSTIEKMEILPEHEGKTSGGSNLERPQECEGHMITEERNDAKTNLSGVETNEQPTLMVKCELRTRIEVDHEETDCARLALQPASIPGGLAVIVVEDKRTVEKMEILPEHERKTSGGNNPERPQEFEGHMITEERNEAKTNLDGVKTNEQPTLMVECELRTRIEVDHGETDCANLALQPASNLLGGLDDIAMEDKTTVEKMEILPEHEGKTSGGSNPREAAREG